MADPKTKILVVDDDLRLRDLLQRYLTEQGFAVHTVSDAAGMDKSLARERVDLLVLDLMLPGEDGLSICRRLRGGKNTVPIIMLTAKGEDVDRIVGLEMGADDYLPKPFNPRELVARVNAVLRRKAASLPPHPASIRTVWGFAYVFVPDGQPHSKHWFCGRARCSGDPSSCSPRWWSRPRSHRSRSSATTKSSRACGRSRRTSSASSTSP